MRRYLQPAQEEEINRLKTHTRTMKRRRGHTSHWSSLCIYGDIFLLWCNFLLPFYILLNCNVSTAEGCPPSEAILPCRCSMRGKEIQIWCSHSNLPQIMDGIKAVDRNIKSPIDELVLENNQLPALPGRFFGSLQIIRLMLRYNSIERLSNGWLNELENSLVEIYIVEPQLRSIPIESLNGMINMIAITIQSDELKHLPDFSGLLSLSYLSVQSDSVSEVSSHLFHHLPKVQNININGGPNLNRLEAGLLDSLISLKNVDLSRNGINWIHLRALTRLPNLVSLKLSYNQISDVGMIGRTIKDLENLKKLRLDHNIIGVIEDGSFVDLPNLAELHLNDNRITDIQYGAFLRTPMLKTIYLHNNHIRRIHPESFLQASGSGVEMVYMYNNEIDRIGELRSILDSLPTLKFLDMSNNYLTEIPFGALRGHGTLEQLHLNNNLLRIIERDAIMAMPALRELRLSNNSLSQELPMPFWNLPGLKGLDLSANNFRTIDSFLLAGLPSLRRLDLSENGLTKLMPTTFLHNTMLETLNISSNELVTIHPVTFRSLDRLFEVDASYNQLMEFIPGLPKIVERISMRGNLITALPVSASKSLNLPNLRMLDLSWNRLEHLPKYGFKSLPQLRVLSLANNRLRSLEDTAFIGAQRLELLHLQENELSHIDERAFLAMPELRNLNLQGNKLDAITDNLFSNNTRLEQLDLSRNQIRTISPASFEGQRSLEYLDLSGNALADISISLANLVNLRDIDLSYNQITRVHADIVASWRNVVEIRLANNLIVELKHGTFRNLPKLQYLDLSSNEIASVEPSALKQLNDLQEFVLADNKLVELKDHVFEDLPNLLASHLQYNLLRYISSESFFNSPSMVFLNLSNNKFQNMDNIGLRSMRNLEVLDLSSNRVRVVPTMPLKALSWLVELKMDNNQICKIRGSPFETMPRLRVLSMRNNHLRTIQERMFRNLRGNIAILDVDGNPIQCSCEMQWLSVWLQETNFPYPGPKCQDGRLLRSSRMDKSLCATYLETNQRTGSSASDTDDSNHLPLLNEHGDIFQRELQLQNELNDECDFYESPQATAAGEQRPLPVESEYFYDQYVDYAPANSTNNQATSSSDIPTASFHGSNANKRPTISSNIDLNNTILNTKFLQKRPPPQLSSSPFTFFGYPIPSLSLGRFFGFGQRNRKDRGEKNAEDLPATHRMQTPVKIGTQRGKVRMYQPNSAEFEKYLKQDKQRKSYSESTTQHTSSTDTARDQYYDVTARNRYVSDAVSDIDAESDEVTAEPHNTKSVFRTSFREPASIEHGGFRPIVPEHMVVGGFMPVPNPNLEKDDETMNAPRPLDSAVESSRNVVPHKRAHALPTELNFVPVGTVTKTGRLSTTTHTYDVTEATSETTETTPLITRGITPPYTATTTTMTTPTTSTTPKVITGLRTITTAETLQAETSTSTDTDGEVYDDLEAQSVGVLKPPPYVPTTTAETILLIPPPEEHAAQIKRNSWVTSTSETTPEEAEDENWLTQVARPTASPSVTQTTGSASVSTSNSGSGRSTITKVHTPQTFNQFLPTAEEYYHRPTTTNPNAGTTESDEIVLSMASGDQRLKGLSGYEHSDYDAIAVDRVDRKDGMDWYYESFKNRRQPQVTTQSNVNDRLSEGNLHAPVSGLGYSRRSGALSIRFKSVLVSIFVLCSCLSMHIWT